MNINIYKPQVTINITEEYSMEESDSNYYRAIADTCGLSERTIRNAFSRKPITWQTACKIKKYFPALDCRCARIKEDKRGQRKTK